MTGCIIVVVINYLFWLALSAWERQLGLRRANAAWRARG